MEMMEYEENDGDLNDNQVQKKCMFEYFEF